MNVWQKFKGWIAKKMNFTVETSPAMKEESFLEWLGVKKKQGCDGGSNVLHMLENDV